MSEQKQVLIIDDERGVVQLCQRLLERAGYQVFTALSPDEGLGFLHQQSVNLLLVDIRMPGMDGFQVMQLARLQQPDLAVLMITGHGTIELAVEALRGGADGLALKPFTADELMQSVKRALEQNHLKREMSRLHTLQPLFEFTNQLFVETTPARLRKLVIKAACEHLRCPAVLWYEWKDPSAVTSARLAKVLQKQIHFCDLSVDCAIEPEEFKELAQKMATSIEIQAPEQSLIEFSASSFTLLAALTPLRIPYYAPGQILEKYTDSPSTSSVKNSWLLLAVMRNKTNATAANPIQGQPFNPADRELISILGRQAATALENALLNAELRRYIQELKTSQCMLLQAEKMATAGRLMASIAHEINNPLQAVQNCLHLTGRSELKAESRLEYLNMAQMELQRLANTVQRMLDFYRPASLERQNTDVHHIIQRVLDLMKKKMEDSQVKVILNFDPALPPAPVVADQIQQVFLNLILNAVEAMPGGGSLTISTFTTDHNEIVLTFQDTGPGIDPKVQKHLFEPFTSAKAGGTGLGLSISYGIIAAHGGTLSHVPRQTSINRDAYTSQAEGACFRIQLPVT